jgi:hypothetical protein
MRRDRRTLYDVWAEAVHVADMYGEEQGIALLCAWHDERRRRRALREKGGPRFTRVRQDKTDGDQHVARQQFLGQFPDCCPVSVQASRRRRGNQSGATEWPLDALRADSDALVGEDGA